MTILPLTAEILGPDILIILVIVAVLFGSSRLPKLARSLGSAKAEFEKGVHEASTGATPLAADPTETVSLTRAELNAMIAEREAGARATRDPGPSPRPPADR